MRGLGLALSLLLSSLASAGDFRNYEDAVAKSQWREATEIAMDLAARNPSLGSVGRMKAAYALFQAGYPNSALSVLAQIPAAGWKAMPSGETRLTEMAVLIQKKVPLAILPGRLDQANPQAASEMIRSELLFARGRAAFERRDTAEAQRWLEQVPRQSRLFAHARYLLGALAVRAGDTATAEREFSQVFEPSVLQQSTEFWRDVSAQMAENWGGNVRVYLDTQELIAENARLGELAALGLARTAYMRRDFPGALAYYSRVRSDSRFAPRASLERIWALLALNRHEEAQNLAGQLAVDQKRFEALEARVVRAIVLTDVGRTEEARRELDGFRLWAHQIREGIGTYEATRAEHGLPAFLLTDFADDKRITATLAYQKDVRDEVDRLRREDARLYPSFRSFAAALEPLVLQARDLNGRLVHVWLEKRKQDLDRLSVQATLVEIETYLEDRERLRKEFRALGQVSERQQADHDERLEMLLRKVVKNTDDLTARGRVKNLRLEMRHSELLWELGSAVAVLAQSRRDKRMDEEASAPRNRAFLKAKEIVA
ncbi:MAG: hypothetical protein HUU37_06125, partial [Bdellovibrionales bacterium]|nr:hypothetical protein [Bdellovibrionales bacterium]